MLRPLPLSLLPEEAALHLRQQPGLVWLDTSGHQPETAGGGGLSLIAAAPLRILTGNLLTDPLGCAPLEEALASLAASPGAAIDCGFPLSGLFGTVDYDGTYRFGVYDEVLIHRHASGTWLASGPRLPALLQQPPPPSPAPPPAIPLRPRRTAAEYREMVRRAQEWIAAGDIYQVNLAHSFEAPWPADADPFSLALELRSASPAPCAAWLDLGGRQILSSSPESFLKMSGGLVRTRPIKGTRPRFHNPADDERSAIDLVRSPKERAELLMITDLLRNDLGQVCTYGSVRVTDLMRLERYSQVFHLVSTIEGTLRPEISHPAALRACFPGGSVTGAPKKRAMEIIQTLEGASRGLYTGAIGYFGSNGESQFSIAIRTLVVENGNITFQAGAGIVADSDPAHEWEETLHKARGILTACRAAGPLPPHSFPGSSAAEPAGTRMTGHG